MGKRLHRFRGEDFIKKSDQLLNLDVNIVLFNGSTFCGVLDRVLDGNYFLKDHRGQIIPISSNQIFEIITDEISSY
jgi:hypothetical protein